uniref:Uncharacterized protein n=1 Tax=Anguilla anguilla TaxID=7936 RepID=A0A0E9PLE7_ANGAN
MLLTANSLNLLNVVNTAGGSSMLRELGMQLHGCWFGLEVENFHGTL